MIYNVYEKPKTIQELMLYGLQQCLSIFVATVLISKICGTPTSSCLFGACIGTILYQLITKFQSPMFISSCGATCSAVIGALSMGNGNNYLAVICGGFIIFVVYSVASIIIKRKGIESINKFLPPSIIGSITIVIGLNLATFIPSYCQVSNQHSDVGIVVAILTMLVVAISSHYFKGFWKTIPFLIGLVFGYVLCIIITLVGIEKMIDFSSLRVHSIISSPDFTFKYIFNNSLSFKDILNVLLLFIPVSLCALCEHYSDHKVLSNIIDLDLTKYPGLHKTLLADGFSSFIGTIVCGLPNTSYGESIATIGFSKVASVSVITTAAVMTGVLSFINPIQVFIASIPSCVFGGCAMILYGYISFSGLRTLLNSQVKFNDKNLTVISVILTTGVSGIFLFSESFTGVSLAMILGILLNSILKEKNNGKKTYQ